MKNKDKLEVFIIGMAPMMLVTFDKIDTYVGAVIAISLVIIHQKLVTIKNDVQKLHNDIPVYENKEKDTD